MIARLIDAYKRRRAWRRLIKAMRKVPKALERYTRAHERCVRNLNAVLHALNEKAGAVLSSADDQRLPNRPQDK